MSKSKLEKIRKLIEKVADETGIKPQEVTKTMMFEHPECDFNDWDIRTAGGITAIKGYFPVEKNALADNFETKDLRKYITNLEKKLGEKEYFEREFTKLIDKHIKPLSIKTMKKQTGKRPKIKRHVVAMLNDTHYGLQVKPEEVANVNTFNWEVAARRTGLFVDEIINFKREKRKEVEKLHFLINGDIIAGVIHNLVGRDNNLLIHQFNGALHILSQAIGRLSENYAKVEVYFSTGNHGDAPHRREGGRVSSQIYDSFEGMIFYALSTALSKAKNVEFTAGHTLFQDFKLPAGRAMFTHGHLLFSKVLGNPGRQINSKNISDEVMRFNNGEIEKGMDKFKLILCGHSHANFMLSTQDGVLFYNAPSFSGIDSYAFQLGINHNLVGQLLFESTDTHIFGDSRLIDVSLADNNKEYDKIIKPYDYELVAKNGK